MAPTRARARARARRLRLPTVLRALGSLLALAALVAGVPWLLLRAGTLPTSWPTPAAIGEALTAPDDGQVLFTLLTVVCWVLWAYFLLSLLLEALSLLARVRVPKIRGLGSGQRLAGVLLGGLLMLPTANAIAATPAHAVSAPQLPHQPVSQGDGGTAAAASPTTVPRGAGEPVHTVGATGETVWDLAEQYLGDGRRHTDIRALNPGLTQSFLTAGTRVHLPADARSPAPPAAGGESASQTVVVSRNGAPAAPGRAAPQHRQEQAGQPSAATNAAPYVVRPGDHLAKIAQEQLGDADRWPELYQENQGEEQPYGRHFENPDLIYPGQHIDLPAQAATPPAPGTGQKPDAKKPPAERVQPPKPTTAPSAPATEGDKEQDQDARGGTEQKPEPARTTVPSPPAPSRTAPVPSRAPETAASARPSTPASPPSADAPVPPVESGSTMGPVAGTVGLAASGAVAAALVGTLATRRLLQRRRLRRGRKIVMPQGRPAATEVLLRSVDASYELQLLDAMVRTLAVHLADASRTLPALAAVRLGEQGALLYLAEPAEPVAPFSALDDSDRQWWCPIDSEQLLDDDSLREVDPPYPALVPLGDDTQGGIVLVDLEHTGVLHFVGDRRQQVLRTLGIALALSPFGGQLELAVAGQDTAPGLSLLDPERVRSHDDLPAALRALAAHQSEQQQVLAAGSGDLATARLDDEVGELWPMVLLTDLDTVPGEGSAAQVTDLVGQEPRTALAVLTSTLAAPAAENSGWVVDTSDPAVTVPGTEVVCAVSACSDEEYADAIDLVLVSGLGDEEEDDSPAPAAAASRPVLSPSPGAEPEAQAPVPLPVSAGGSPLAALADLEDNEPGKPQEAPAGPETAKDPADGATAPAPPPETASPATSPVPLVPPAAATGPAEIVLPALAPTSRVSARIPAEQPAVPVLPEEPDRPEGPYIQVLGPVTLDGAQGSITTNRRTTAMEFVAWLALHPGADPHQIDDLLAPGGRVTRDTRNSRTSDVRRWLGHNADDAPYLPHLTSQPDRLLRLDGVACDWQLFQQYADQGHHDPGPDGARLLRHALHLVRGRPFAGVPARRYQWAEPFTQDMIKKIVHAAEDLADRCLSAGDGRGALWAAIRGLDVAREVEVLWRMQFRALALLGQLDDLEQAVRALEAFLLDLGCSMDDETLALLEQVQGVRH